MLMILRMFEVDNINIITTHLLQVIHARLEAEALRKNGVRLRIIFSNFSVILMISRVLSCK